MAARTPFKLCAIVGGGEGEEGRTVRLDGRPAWMLQKLHEAGKSGLTTTELPASLRVSHYIFLLRTRHGIAIETEREGHDGPFSGNHARYRLRSPVRILAEEEMAA
jgi:hypothetical protein